MAAMAEAGARELDNDAAMVREITTPEEIVRVMEEEAERLKDPETKAVRSDHLEQAVFDRLVRKMEEHYPHHPMIKFLKPQRGGEVK